MIVLATLLSADFRHHYTVW